jgi:AcrR family transcriptional regulator
MARGRTRDRIEEAAIALFNDQGTAAVSTNHIAEAAGISPGNLYYHFRNKEEIIRGIFERMNASWGQVVALPRDDDTSPLGHLQMILRATFPLLWEYRFFYREFVALMRRDPELGRRYREVRAQGLANTEATLNAFVAEGVLRLPGDPNTLPRLSKNIWLIIEFWLPFAELGEESIEPKHLEEGVALLMQVLAPYLTNDSIAGPGAGRPDHSIREDKS